MLRYFETGMNHSENSVFRESIKVLKISLLSGLSTWLLYRAIDNGDRGLVFRDPWFAMLVNLALTGWVVLISKLVPLRYNHAYYRVRRVERRLYERLGIRWFQKLLRSRFYQVVINRPFFFDGSRISLDVLNAHMRMAEASHLTAFLLSALLSIFAFWKGWIDGALWLLFFNLAFNAYPVMLQRYNRDRLAVMARRHRDLMRHSARKNRPESRDEDGNSDAEHAGASA